MIASGLPKRNGNDHAVQIALSALHIVHVVSHYSFPHVTDNGLQIRVGLHSGNFTETDSFEHIYLAFLVLLWTASRPVSITTIPSRPCFMTPSTRQRQCTLPRGHDSLHWFCGLEVVQRSTPFLFGVNKFLPQDNCKMISFIPFSNKVTSFIPGCKIIM